MINAVKKGALTISPDLWSDKFKQNSYLGLTAHFVDDNHVLHVIDLCCGPYNEINERAENIVKVSNENEPEICLFSLPFLLLSNLFDRQLLLLYLDLALIVIWRK